MDRPIIYAEEQGRSADFLGLSRAAYVGLAKLAAAALGSNTAIAGLLCTPGTGLHVVLGEGEIYSPAATDTAAYGTLTSDAHSILKQGILADPAILSVPAPGTGGQSINYLIEVQLQETDTNNVSLPYYDSSNPTVPIYASGNTLRQDVCAVQVKAGTPAATGSQTTPSVDAGWTGLYVVTVANGAVSILTGNISVYPGAPFLSVAGSITDIPGKVQNNVWVYAGAAGGTANALTASIAPAPAALVDGLGIIVKATAINTGPATINLNGLGVKAITLPDGTALSGAELATGAHVHLIYDGTQFQIAGSKAADHASAWHQIAQTSITSVVAVDFTALGSTYDDLLIDMAGFGVPSAGVGLQIAFSSDGGSTWSTPQYLTGPTDLQTAGSPRYDLVALYTGWSRTRGVVASSGVGSNGGTPNALASSGVRPAIRILPSVSGFVAAGTITIFGR